MIRRRWKCHEGIGDKILEILKNNKTRTTSGIILKLKDYDFFVTWKLVNSYLCEFESDKKVTRIQIGDKHKINFWNIE